MTETDFVVDKQKLQVVMTRVFHASPEKLWRATTERDLLPKWWGPRNLTTTVDKWEMRVGGAWRAVQKDEQGNEFAFNGVFTAIQKPKLLSFTFNYEPIGAGHEVIDTIRFEEPDGGPSSRIGSEARIRTKVTDTSDYPTIEDLEGMLASGMEKGAIETWDRLAELLETL